MLLLAFRFVVVEFNKYEVVCRIQLKFCKLNFIELFLRALSKISEDKVQISLLIMFPLRYL